MGRSGVSGQAGAAADPSGAASAGGGASAAAAAGTPDAAAAPASAPDGVVAWAHNRWVTLDFTAPSSKWYDLEMDAAARLARDARAGSGILSGFLARQTFDPQVQLEFFFQECASDGSLPIPNGVSDSHSAGFHGDPAPVVPGIPPVEETRDRTPLGVSDAGPQFVVRGATAAAGGAVMNPPLQVSVMPRYPWMSPATFITSQAAALHVEELVETLDARLGHRSFEGSIEGVRLSVWSADVLPRNAHTYLGTSFGAEKADGAESHRASSASDSSSALPGRGRHWHHTSLSGLSGAHHSQPVPTSGHSRSRRPSSSYLQSAQQMATRRGGRASSAGAGSGFELLIPGQVR